jgi:hypothetical protein
MLRLAFTGALTALLLIGSRPLAAAEDKVARAIIDRAVAAQGGEANLAKAAASSVKFKGKFHSETGDGDMTGTVQTQDPDRLRFEAKLNIGGGELTILQVVNRDKGWFSFNGDPQEFNDDMRAEAREQLHAGRVADLRGVRGPDVTLTTAGEIKVGAKTAEGVRVARKGYRDVNLYFDKDSSLLLKSETRTKDPITGAEFAEAKFYSDYKKVNGLMVAHKVEATRDGKPHAETELTEVTFSDKLPDATFAKP